MYDRRALGISLRFNLFGSIWAGFWWLRIMGPNLTLGVFLHHGAPRAYANANLWQEAMAEHNREWQEAPLAHYMYCLFISFFAIFGTLGNMFVSDIGYSRKIYIFEKMAGNSNRWYLTEKNNFTSKIFLGPLSDKVTFLQIISQKTKNKWMCKW